MIRLGNLTPKAFFLGNRPVSEIWHGQKKVWPELTYDAEIDYIRVCMEPVNDSLLDTGLAVNDNDWAFEADCLITYVSTNWRGPFLAYTNETTQSTRVLTYQNRLDSLYVGYRRQANSQTQITPGNGWTLATRSKHKVSYLKYELTPDGGQTQTFTLPAPSGTAAPSSQTMKLAFVNSWGRLYGFKAWHSEQLVMDLIPVRVGSTPMLYDKVEKRLMPLNNTVEDHVLPGPDLNPTGLRRVPVETNSYAQDGLVAMWDAKENAGVGLHTQQMSNWKNLGSLGSTYDFTDPTDNINWSGDCLVTNAFSAQMTSPMIPRDSIKTMEVYFNTIAGETITANNSRFRMFVFGDRLTRNNYQMTRRCIEWDVNSGNRGWMFGTGNALPSGQTGTSVPLGRHHFSVVYPSVADTDYATGDQPVRILRDGSVWNVASWLVEGDAVQQKQSIGTAYNSAGNYISGTGTYEKIYCIRLYNRQLTLAEQQANYALDVQRFG